MAMATRKTVFLTSALGCGIFVCVLLFHSHWSQDILPMPLRGPPKPILSHRITAYIDLHRHRTEEYTKTLTSETSSVLENSGVMPSPGKPTLLTLFTSWSESSTRATVNNNTLNNWRLLFNLNVTAVLFTNSTRTGDHARQLGWIVLPILHDIPKGAGTPILPKLFQQVRTSVSSDLYGYANGDILFDNSLVDTIIATLRSSVFSSPLLFQEVPTLITGRRTNVKNIKPADAMTWQGVQQAAKSRGRKFVTMSEDYFITNRDYPWETYPPIAIGVRAFDNWLVIRGNELHHITIDSSKSILAVHQDTKTDKLLRRAKPNWDYNVNILSRIFDFVDYSKGQTICCHYETQREAQTITVYKKPKLLC